MFSFLRRRFDAIDNPYARATTPDQLIEAAFIQSIAKDFTGWGNSGLPNVSVDQPLENYKKALESRKIWQARYSANSDVNSQLSKGDMVLVYRRVTRRDRDEWGRHNYIDVVTYSQFHVKSGSIWVPLADASGIHILESYKRVKTHWEEVQRVAAEAKRKMEEEERKWNLAESLLGMKRNEFGALVPVQEVK